MNLHLYRHGLTPADSPSKDGGALAPKEPEAEHTVNLSPLHGGRTFRSMCMGCCLNAGEVGRSLSVLIVARIRSVYDRLCRQVGVPRRYTTWCGMHGCMHACAGAHAHRHKYMHAQRQTCLNLQRYATHLNPRRHPRPHAFPTLCRGSALTFTELAPGPSLATVSVKFGAHPPQDARLHSVSTAFDGSERAGIANAYQPHGQHLRRADYGMDGSWPEQSTFICGRRGDCRSRERRRLFGCTSGRAAL